MKTTRLIKLPTGFTLIELVLVIVIIGIIGTAALREMLATIEDARLEQTRNELDQLAFAIAGNPALTADGRRTDFGYVGDIGALPPDLDALVANPGLATWRGPYIYLGISPANHPSVGSHLTDDWNTPYTYSAPSTGPLSIRSIGSGTPIDRTIAPACSDLLANTVSGFITDAHRQPPGPIYRDSLSLLLSYPNGSGALATAATIPTSDGTFSFTGIPIGNHTLRIIYLPAPDTTIHTISIPPASDLKLDLTLPADLW